MIAERLLRNFHDCWNSQQLAGLLLVGFVLLLAACGGRRSSPYSSHEHVLSIATEFQLLAERDPYREAPGEDLLGESTARGTLARLENYRELHPQSFGRELAMLRGRALELLSDLEGAAAAYREAGAQDSPLQQEARERTARLEELIRVRNRTDQTRDLRGTLRALQEQGSAFRELADSWDEAFYRGLALAEGEKSDVLRAELLATHRHVLPNGTQRTEEALRALTQDHKESHRTLQHVWRLARFYQRLAREEARLHPPEQAGFDAERFRRHFREAAELLYRLSQADGRREKVPAARELDAWLAYGDSISQRAQ